MAEHRVKVKKVKGGWEASCPCGWEANNPLDDERDAHEARAYHLERVEADEAEADRIAAELRGEV